MYSMFSQIPFTSLVKVFLKQAVYRPLLTVNFPILPIVVWLLFYFVVTRLSATITGCLFSFINTLYRLCHCFHFTRSRE